MSPLSSLVGVGLCEICEVRSGFAEICETARYTFSEFFFFLSSFSRIQDYSSFFEYGNSKVSIMNYYLTFSHFSLRRNSYSVLKFTLWIANVPTRAEPRNLHKQFAPRRIGSNETSRIPGCNYPISIILALERPNEPRANGGKP